MRIRIYCLIVCAPIVILSLALMWRASFSVKASVLGAEILALLLLTSFLLEEIVRPLQTLANVVAALREEDYSFRARAGGRQDALGELSAEINALADMIQSQRLGELESAALLRRVITSMDAPVLAFDRTRRLRLMNPPAERALALNAERDYGRRAEELDLGHLLDAPDEAILGLHSSGVGGEAALPAAHKSRRWPGRWMIRRSNFRQSGAPHTLLLLSDVSSALREEERMAWQRLIRVLGHEISNSLAPIKSIAGSLRARLSSDSPERVSDFAHGLTIIEGRAESLNRFVQAYRQLAQLPAPAMRSVPLRPLLERVVALETRMDVGLGDVPAVNLVADPDQLEQLLINLLKNAVEAVISAREEQGDKRNGTGGVERAGAAVMLSARDLRDSLAILVEDAGVGLTNTANLFVPFYTTKRNGSGVGLALVRQIAEAHGGTVSLRNREDAQGCVAEVRIPFVHSSS
jgi:nitrogen fixation/metabolism regulation signal transduction histidine kinase